MFFSRAESRHAYVQIGFILAQFSPWRSTDWLIIQVLAACLFTDWICTVSLILFGLYTDWLRTGSRRGYIQIGYIEVLALAKYNLATYMPLLCTLQTEEPGAPGDQVRPEAHRNSVDSGMHRLHGGTSWKGSSLKFIALSRQKKMCQNSFCAYPARRAHRFPNIAIPARGSRQAKKRNQHSLLFGQKKPHGAADISRHNSRVQIHTSHRYSPGMST